MRTILPSFNTEPPVPLPESERRNDRVVSSSMKSAAAELNLPKVIENLYAWLLLLLPFFILPFTADKLSLNKSYLVLFIAAVVLVLFLLDGLKRSLLTVKSFSAYLPALILFAAAIVSAIFSINVRLSFFGGYENYSNSVIFFAALLVLAFVAANTRLGLDKLSKFLVVGVTLSAFVSYLSLFGFAFPLIGAIARGTTLAGSMAHLLGLIVISLIISLKKFGDGEKVYGVFLFVLLSFLFITLNPVALILLALGTGILVFAGLIDFVGQKRKFSILGMALAFFLFLHYFQPTRVLFGINDMQQLTFPFLFRLPLKESWLIAIDTLRNNAFWGTGPGTFIVDFSNYRPASLNTGELWNSRLSQPFNDLFWWMAVGGLTGLLAYLGFWILVIRNALNFRTQQVVVSSLIAVLFMVLFFLGNNPVLYVFLFVLLGFSAQHRTASVFTLRNKDFLLFLVVVAAGLLGVLGFGAYKVYAAQYNYNESLKANDLILRLQSQERALQNDQYESVYRRARISTNLEIAKRLSERENLTQTEIEQINELIRIAVLDARILTEVINPRDVVNWQLRGVVYSSVIGLAEGVGELAIQAYSQAVQLEPTNPLLWIDLGGVYHRLGDYQSSAQMFARAVQLKNDLPNAHYNLAVALKELGDYQNAVIQMEIVTRLITQDHPDYSQVEALLAGYNGLLEEARQQALEQAQTEVPVEDQNPEEVQPTRNAADQPIVGPEEGGEFNLNEESGVEIDDESVNPGADDSTDTQDDTETEEEAPLSNPPEE